MSLEDVLVAHAVVSWLLPDELGAPADLLKRLPLPTPSGCVVVLVELRQMVAAGFAKERRAVGSSIR